VGARCATLEETAYVASGLVSLLKQGRGLLSDAERADLRAAFERSRRFLRDVLHAEEVFLPSP
jgi:hypothetical protein